MSLNILLPELIIHISNFVTMEYLDFNNDTHFDIINNSLALKDMGHCYYDVRNLYATCKSFQWMLTKLECICVEKNIYYHHITTRNINGKANGMFFNINHYIVEYALFKNGIEKYSITRCKEKIKYRPKCAHYKKHNWNNSCENCLMYNDNDFLYDLFPFVKQVLNNENGYVLVKYKK